MTSEGGSGLRLARREILEDPMRKRLKDSFAKSGRRLMPEESDSRTVASHSKLSAAQTERGGGAIPYCGRRLRCLSRCGRRAKNA
jgi:hypothetical protein